MSEKCVVARLSSRAALRGACSLVVLALATPAFAQTTPTPADTTDSTAVSLPTNGQGTQGEEVVVTGLRGSLQRNLDLKRSATGVIDAISAEDIGKFPDSNVAASLQRLPGVSIQRSGARGEPTGVTVRGFGGDFVATLYDGRRISTATGGRAIDFSTVGSDFVGQLDVLKTPDMALNASSIGATIDIKFPKPMDHPGFRLASSASASIQDGAGKIVPSGGLLLSDTFADDTFGILVDGIYTRHDTRTNRVDTNGWQGTRFAPCQLTAACADGENTSATQTKVGWYPQDYTIARDYTKDERIDGRIAIQWQPSDDLLLTIDDNFSRQDIHTTVNGMGVWFNSGALQNIKQDANGTVIDFTQAGSPMDFVANDNRQVLQTNQLGANLKWNASERLHFDLDAAWGRSYLNPGDFVANRGGDIGYGGVLGANTGVQVTGKSSDSFPTLVGYGPNGDPARLIDPTIIGTHVLTDSTQRNRDDVKQIRLTGSWEQDQLKIRFGGQYIHDRFQLHNENTFYNNFWQSYAGYGPPSGRSSGVLIPAGFITGTFNTRDFIPGFSGSLPAALPIFSATAQENLQQSFGNPYEKNIPGFNYPGATDTGNGLLNYRGLQTPVTDPGSVQNILESTWAAFITISQTTQIANMPFHIAFGAREEVTHITSAGLGTVPTSLSVPSSDPTAFVFAFSGTTPVSTRSNYSYFLPSLDLSLDVTDQLKLRFDASRTLTRPPLNRLTPVLTGVGGRVNALVATGGNPNLQPYLSDNFDVAAEWYYHANSYFSVDLFAKQVTNFIVAGSQRQTINGVVDPTTGQPAVFTVSSYLNGPNATVKGVEVALQHVFGDTGFGFQANGTFVQTNKPYDRFNISQSGFAVTGLANSANFVGFYDKNGFQIRGAVNWRDKYLSQFGQVQNNSAFGTEPTFVDSQVQVDLSTSYQINKNLDIFFEALNLNNAVLSSHGRFDNQLLQVFDYGRRFTLGVHFRI
ncbi:TonB-dependent receptor [Sphingomonas sp. 8AM]|uniref:TonB-dependent receptor n=1 Tax=Sphingomonas sp. 8AM TaxID=2653170 RepID=UPI0012F3868C|nr:TonB-dependent receptor [Sphingomonas sp. 8AM]VXD01617.1 TonB-dependent receptor [Sphingomonas sp. 8AM]